jgi:hypothetical protein
MKRKIALVIIGLMALAPFALSSSTVSAANVFGVCSTSTDSGVSANGTDVCKSAGSNPPGTNPVIDALRVAINILSFVVGVASVIVIIISSLRMVLNGGDPQAVGRARNGIIYALVGILVVAVSQSLVVFILDKIK